MKLLRPSVLSVVLLVSQACAQDTPDLTGVEILTHPVAGNIYMLEATGDVAGNIAVSVGPDGVLIVDDQFAELTDQIVTAIRELDKGALRFIINTHHHLDHAGGNAALKHKEGSVIIAHDHATERLKEFSRDHWPTITFSDKMSVHFNDEEIRVLAVPGGHTDNDAIIFFTKSNVIHMGDLYNSGISSYPTADIGAGGSAFRILENIKYILPLIPDDAKIIAGHGPLSGKAGVVQLKEMLEDTISHVVRQKEAGKTVEQIIAEGLPSKYDDWGLGYTSAEHWIMMIYESEQ